MNPRLRRLDNDYRELRRRFDGESHVHILPVGPMPPEQYVVTFRVPSLRQDARGELVRTDQTVVTVTLPSGYPREKPHAVTYDPVFHPNFGAYVCIADFWAPGQSLADIIASISDMLQFKKYNIRSPLNAVAAEWANAHASSLPLSTITLGETSQQLDIALRPPLGTPLLPGEHHG